MMFRRRSASALTGLALLVVAAFFAIMGSVLLIMECMAIGFVVSLAATVLSAIGAYDTVRNDLKGTGIAFWTLLLSLGLIAYSGVAAAPWALRMMF